MLNFKVNGNSAKLKLNSLQQQRLGDISGDYESREEDEHEKWHL